MWSPCDGVTGFRGWRWLALSLVFTVGLAMVAVPARAGDPRCRAETSIEAEPQPILAGRWLESAEGSAELLIVGTVSSRSRLIATWTTGCHPSDVFLHQDSSLAISGELSAEGAVLVTRVRYRGHPDGDWSRWRCFRKRIPPGTEISRWMSWLTTLTRTPEIQYQWRLVLRIPQGTSIGASIKLRMRSGD